MQRSVVSGRLEALALKTAAISVARGFLLAMLTGAIAVPAWAQVGPALRLSQEQTEQAAQRSRTRYRVGLGLNTPEAQAAARAFRQARAEGRIPLPSKAAHKPLDVGDTLTFNTKAFLAAGWRPLHFTLLFEGDDFKLWVETAERDNGHVQDADIDTLVEVLSMRTPEGSINPEAGILENNTTLFGDLPNYDGDGILDILWFDIFDDYPSPSPLVGYFAPEDYNPNALPGQGNQADVLYLDTNPLLIGVDFGIEDVKQVAVQIHQQLIHFNQDPNEHPFVSRGLAEWAKLLNGYDACDSFYLLFPSQEHNIAFLSWNPIEPFLGDVQRAALFTNYLAEQLGREAAVSLVPELATGADGYRAVLQAHGDPRSVEDLVLDFHTANYLNDAALDPRFGYTTPACQEVQALPLVSVDASMSTAMDTTITLRAGSVQYFFWENVRQLRINLSLNGPAVPGRVRLRAVLEGLDGAVSFVNFEPGDEIFEGNYNSVVLILFYDQLDDEGRRAPVTLSTTWDGPAVFTENVAYDEGLIASAPPNFIRLVKEAIQAVRFEVPAGTRLAKVFLAPFYENQFVDSTGLPLGAPTDPRDFILHVWADDGAGRPGDELFALEQSDPRFFVLPSFTLNHFLVDLSAYPELSTLPEVIYVGFSNTGADANHLVFALAPHTGDNPSFLFSEVDGLSQWRSLATLTTSEGETLEDRVIPIRAQFQGGIVRTAVDEAEARAPLVALLPNYPNPFNPRTTIRYSLPQTAPVRLTVYDLLGRVVAVLVDALEQAGEHRVSLDASAWASGAYFYTLESLDQRLTRAMLLIK